jgi:hypothetical protein
LDLIPRLLRRELLAAAAAASLLAGCGGGGGGEGGGADTSPPPAVIGKASVCADGSTAWGTTAKSGVAVGRNGAVVVAGCAGPIDSPQWVQTGGAAVQAALSDKTQTLDFQAPSPGTYRFRVSFRDAQGAARSEEVVQEVEPAAGDTSLALRVSQSVRMGGNVSVRAWPQLAAGDAMRSIVWQQTEGPAVTLDTGDSHVALFTAPAVARDTLIRLRATLTTTAGATASDEALVLVEHHTQASENDSAAVWRGEHVSRVYAYRSSGPHAAALRRCVYDTALRDSTLCPLSQLPFLAQETGGALPSIEQVMNRVLVSHDWIGRNFETFLREHDSAGDLRRMLQSVTAIVIGSHVRPSFYYAGTGAIYLDADNFWLTPDERDTVNEAPDFRSHFGDPLQYTTLWRYVRGNTNIFRAYHPRQREARGTPALLDEAGWLLFHELAHALDFLPPAAYGSLVASAGAWANIAPRVQAGQLTSDRVPALYPLASSALAGLGQVRFLGAAADATQRAYTPQQVAAWFAADLATDDYAYASPREDIAMTLEEFLMSRRLDLRRDFAITPRWGPGTTGATALVVWGQRGRVAEPALRARLRLVVQQLTPWIAAGEADLLPPPIAMRAGDSWTGNLTLPAPLSPSLSPRIDKGEPSLHELWLLEQTQRRRTRLQSMGKPLPKWPAAAATAAATAPR